MMLFSIYRQNFIFILGLLSVVLLSGCGSILGGPTITPIYVTATPRVVIVTPTPTPRATSVVAPTLPSDATQVSLLETAPPTPTVITMTPTFTPTPTDTPPTPGVSVFVPSGGVGGVGFSQPVGACSGLPSGGFANVYNTDPNIAAQLSCPIGGAVSVSSAYQTFERGIMIWVSQAGTTGQSAIYVLYSNNTYQRFSDTWREGVDPSSTGLVPPSSNLQEPVRGFGKVWREAGGVRDNLGWATGTEQGGSGATQVFERGEMVYISQTGQTYILFAGAPGTWTSVAIPY
ncbi:MAG: hypothetical protein CUN55_11355 [Phototrophicales bacterium]|nr:MAG: hypothetical protein CUN55_11355 [Phototrophicales bacterium]